MEDSILQRSGAIRKRLRLAAAPNCLGHGIDIRSPPRIGFEPRGGAMSEKSLGAARITARCCSPGSFEMPLHMRSVGAKRCWSVAIE